jgi:hypothetical protein
MEELAQLLEIPDTGRLRGSLDELEKEDAIFRERETGRIVAAYPYSSVRTPHQVSFTDGTKVWAMCAIDALGIHFMVGQDITIETVSPRSGVPITIRMADGRVSSVEPRDVVVWRTDRRPQEAHDATTCCPGTNFFSSKDVLEEWRRETGEIDGEVLSLPEAAKRGEIIFGRLLD